MNESTPDLIGTAEVARMLGKSHRTVHRMVADGLLVPKHIAPGGPSGIFLFSRAELEAAFDPKTPA